MATLITEMRRQSYKTISMQLTEITIFTASRSLMGVQRACEVTARPVTMFGCPCENSNSTKQSASREPVEKNMSGPKKVVKAPIRIHSLSEKKASLMFFEDGMGLLDIEFHTLIFHQHH